MKEIVIDSNSRLIRYMKYHNFISEWDFKYNTDFDSCALNKQIIKFGLAMLVVGFIISLITFLLAVSTGNVLAWLVWISIHGYIVPTEIVVGSIVLYSIALVVFGLNYIGNKHNKYIHTPRFVSELAESAKNKFCRKVVFVDNTNSEENENV